MNRAKANSLTRRVQVLALLFAAGAVAAGVIPMSAPSSASAVGGATAAPVPVKPAAAPLEVNAPALATAIDLIAPPVVPHVKPDPEDEPVASTPSAWKYLGAIISGAYRRAVVTVNDKQQLVQVGTKVDTTEVMEIDPAFVRIKDGAGVEQKIDLEARQKTQLSIAAPAGRSATHNPGMRAEIPLQNPKGMSPELAEQVGKALMELREAKELSDDDRREKLRGMFPKENLDFDSLLTGKGGGGKGGGGKGGGRGGK